MALVRIGVGVAAANWIDLGTAVLLLLDALGQPRPALLEVHGRHFSPRVPAGQKRVGRSVSRSCSHPRGWFLEERVTSSGALLAPRIARAVAVRATFAQFTATRSRFTAAARSKFSPFLAFTRYRVNLAEVMVSPPGLGR